ncbi:RagB/SusD family nutrient uptake outer membrane protein [Plebeiibacterium sediminum]|uniref:RagB/SusD family nutrient uptake outer membrane protein n=1 Tax=Plebeiibacterium sediminum TaxID=2992112 RepID=A0AAE3SF19_9BACT|nr:RagB/SusD family nutrient uptake outer membrane protein [Plebeiobacterium sediminum]MCW3787005.1 RagB/SusD family nutrient uptake outer membrane protein [Plebeiobacterium sediminum]
MNKYFRLLYVGLAFSVSLMSCQDFLDAETSDILTKDEMYTTTSDVESVIKGIYGELMELSEQYVVLNELRGDLMTVTSNSNQDLIDLNEHNVSSGNVYADPRPFYKVINDCNDLIKNLNIMLDDNGITKDNYNIYYSEAVSVRSWLYLQLGIQFGSVPYITEPIETVDDLKTLQNYQKVPLTSLISQLIVDMETVPVIDTYSDKELISDDDKVFFINKYCLLGDLYLWDNQYNNAAKAYKSLMMLSGTSEYNKYRLVWGDVVNHDDLVVGYTRYLADDVESLIDDPGKGWESIFTRTDGTIFLDEWIWAMYFDADYSVTNPFIKLFANTGKGEYLVAPSQYAMDNWDSQIQLNNITWDARGKYTWEEMNGSPVITKYIKNYDPATPYDRDGFWYLYRAALLHLRFCEAANRDNESRLAYALLNFGVQSEYTDPDALDITYLERTNKPWPYDFDARMDATGQIPVGVRGIWHRNAGVRGGRGNLQSTVYPADTAAFSQPLEDAIFEEASLALAYEGNRWADLVRISMRRGQTDGDNGASYYLAQKIADEFEKEGLDGISIKAKLNDQNNWWLPWPTE